MEAPFSNKNQKHLKAFGFSDHFLSFLLRLLQQILSKSTIIILSKLKIIYLVLLGELWVFIRLFQPTELPGPGFGEEFGIVPVFSPGKHREMWLHPSPSISQPKGFIKVENPTWSQENTRSLAGKWRCSFIIPSWENPLLPSSWLLLTPKDPRAQVSLCDACTGHPGGCTQGDLVGISRLPQHFQLHPMSLQAIPA